MPARLRLAALLAASGLVLTLPSVADGSLAPLAVPAPPAPGVPAGQLTGQPAVQAARQPVQVGGRVAGRVAVPQASAGSPAAAAVSAAVSAHASAAGVPAPVGGGLVGNALASAQANATAKSKTATGGKAGRGAAAKGAAGRGKGQAKAAAKAAPPSAPASDGQRVDPGWVTVGHYIRSLRNARGPHGDAHWMYVLGARDAARNPGGMKHLVLLDIGGQVHDGVHLSTMSRFVSYASLVRSLGAYIDGYHARQRGNAPVIIAVGTNNDLAVDTNQGIAWARQVINPLRTHAKSYGAMTIAGADDIEPGFRAGPVETQQWLNGYLASTTAPFVFNGSADGCSAEHTLSHCNSGWSSRDIVRFAGVLAPGRILALPQIYNETMAAQWSQLARAAVAAGHRPLQIVGPLTENQACAGDPSCPTMPSWQAYRRLMAGLRRMHVAPTSMPYQVDLDVH